MTTPSPYYGPGGSTDPAVILHFCEPENDHRSHHFIGVGRQAGWFALTKRGCLVDIRGPFATEAEAQAVGDAWLADQNMGRGAS